MIALVGSMQAAESVVGELSTEEVIVGVIIPNKSVIIGELTPVESDSEDDIN